MDDFFLFLLDLNDNLDLLDRFFSEPHCPEDALVSIDYVRIYEENLCKIMSEAETPDKDKAFRAYDELMKHMKNKPYQLQECFAPVEVLEACNDPP